jgi:gamma-glutamylcysteine synthetase
MVDNTITDEMIREKICQMFLESTKRSKKEYIGIEIEIPIINLNKEAVDFDIVHRVTESFKNHFNSFEVEGIDYDGNVYALRNSENDDIVCYDCSYNNIAFAMGKEEDLFTINERFEEYYSFIKEEFERYNHTLSGMGINPYRKYNNEIPIPSERYLMLYNHLKSVDNYSDSLMYFHDYPGYGMFSSASQVQLDVPYDDLIENINVFSKLEPIKALLFSNSVLLGDNEDYVCFRDNLWEYSTHGINPHNIGMYDIEFDDVKELVSYLESLNIYCVMREGIYINFPSMPLKDYFNSDSIVGEC